jgi:hypothetical protein
MPESITCSGCDTTWTGLAAAHCGSCHETFSGAALFDRHRHARGDHGGCLDPATIINTRTGERIMYRRDGMWRSPEMPEEVKAARFGRRS